MNSLVLCIMPNIPFCTYTSSITVLLNISKCKKSKLLSGVHHLDSFVILLVSRLDVLANRKRIGSYDCTLREETLIESCTKSSQKESSFDSLNDCLHCLELMGSLLLFSGYFHYNHIPHRGRVLLISSSPA